jgi:hypothetical protein
MQVSKGATAAIIVVAVLLLGGIGYFVFFRTPTGGTGNEADMRSKVQQFQNDMKSGTAANGPGRGGGGMRGGYPAPGGGGMRGGYPAPGGMGRPGG